MTTRRRLAMLGLAAVGCGWGFPAVAQERAKLPRIGWLSLNTLKRSHQQFAAFWQGLNERGWVEGRNVLIEARRADGQADRLPALAAELVRLEVDVIVAGGSAATQAAKAATRSIPIVMAASANALGEGFVAGLARPGGNITGTTFLAGPEIAGKQLQLLLELAPAASRMAVLANPDNASHAVFGAHLSQVAAPALKLRLLPLEARTPDQFDTTFAALARGRASGLLVLTDGMFFGQRRQLVELAAKARLPAMYSQREFVEAGELASYGPNLADMFRRAATHVDKILKGTSPGDIPLEQPTRFELVINLKTAKALGITIPQSVQLRADDVID
jgi:putative tryptophan/tyrosine transport system substrate-binding protein